MHDIGGQSTLSGHRFEIRVPKAVKERLRRAAALTGRSMSDFVTAAIIEKADEAIEGIERWELDAIDSVFVLNLLTRGRNAPELAALLALSKPDGAEFLAAVASTRDLTSA